MTVPSRSAAFVVLLSVFLLPAACFSRRVLQQPQDDAQQEPSDEDGRPVWIFFVIPVVSGLVAYATNVVAVVLTFYPIEFKGWRIWQPKGKPYGLFGWQGIIPSKAPHITGSLTDLFTTKLIDVKRAFARIDPLIVTEQCRTGSEAISKITTDKIVTALFPSVWTALPQYAKNECVDMVYKESSEFIAILMSNLKEHILNVLDMRAMVERLAARSKSRVVEMCLQVSAPELRFLKLSGLSFGFLLGAVESAAFYFYGRDWVLPVAGFLAGLIANLLAMKLLFLPANPHKFLCINFQGAFLKRQKEAAISIAELSEKMFLRPRHIIWEILNGKHSAAFYEMLDVVSHTYLERVANPMEKLGANLFFGPQGVETLKSTVAGVVREEIHKVLPLAYKHMEEALDLRRTLTVQLQALPPAEFANTMKPVFEDDEMKFIVMGGVTGLIAGVIQWFGVYSFFS